MQDWKRDTDVQNRLWDSVGDSESGMFWENSTEASILSREKQTTSPGWMHETSAQGWCTGKTQRDQMGREAVGGIGMGNTCKSWLIHVNVLQKPLQYYKVISLQLIKINEKEINKGKLSPEYSLEALRMKLNCQYFGHLMWWTDSLEMCLMLEKTEGRRRGWQRMRSLDGIANWMDIWMDITLSKL